MASPPNLSQYDALIQHAAAANGVDPNLLRGLIAQESGGNPLALSSAGAEGLTQLMPGTASGLGVSNPWDPRQSIEGGAAYLGQQLKTFGGNVDEALAAYNAGPGAVEKAGGVPSYDETVNYVQSVKAYAAQYAQEYGNSAGASAPPSAGGSSQAEQSTADAGFLGIPGAITRAEQNLSDTATTLSDTLLVGSLAVALIGGGFAWLAASGKG